MGVLGQATVIHIQADIEINSSLSEAYRLISDGEAKARLNPEFEVLGASRTEPGPVSVGTRTLLCLRAGNELRTFETEVVACESNRFIEWVADTSPGFRVRQSLEMTATGCRLTHEEWIEELPATAVEPRNILEEIADAFQLAAGMDIAPAPAQGVDPSAELRDIMQRQVVAWLGKIKEYLERPGKDTAADLARETIIAF